MSRYESHATGHWHISNGAICATVVAVAAIIVRGFGAGRRVTP